MGPEAKKLFTLIQEQYDENGADGVFALTFPKSHEDVTKELKGFPPELQKQLLGALDQETLATQISDKAKIKFETENYEQVFAILESPDHTPDLDVTQTIDGIEFNLLTAAVHFGKFSIVDLLLTKKEGAANFTSRRVDTTPLWFAARNGDIAIAELLIKYGAEINPKTASKENTYSYPIHIAAHVASTNPEKKDFLNFLLLKGADPESLNNKGKKPVELTDSEEIKNLLTAATKLKQLANSFDSNNISQAKIIISDAFKTDPCFTLDYLHQAFDNNQLGIVKIAIIILESAIDSKHKYATRFHQLKTRTNAFVSDIEQFIANKRHSETKIYINKMLEKNFVATMTALDEIASTQTSFVRSVFFSCKDTINPLFKKAQLEQSVRNRLQIYIEAFNQSLPTPKT